MRSKINAPAIEALPQNNNLKENATWTKVATALTRISGAIKAIEITINFNH